MDWGDLTEFPFLAVVWGTAGEWAGSIASFLAIVTGIVYFSIERRNDIRGQASLIDCRIMNLFDVDVINRSDHSIVNVEVTGEVLSMWKAASIGEYDGATLWRGDWAPYPSLEFYREARDVIRKMKARRGELGGRLVAGEVKPNTTGRIRAARLDVGAYYFLRFRDARGRDWKLDIATKKLHRVRHWWKPHIWIVKRIAAAWWITKSAVIVTVQGERKLEPPSAPEPGTTPDPQPVIEGAVVHPALPGPGVEPDPPRNE